VGALSGHQHQAAEISAGEIFCNIFQDIVRETTERRAVGMSIEHGAASYTGGGNGGEEFITYRFESE
jgi:hypothetical protein